MTGAEGSSASEAMAVAVLELKGTGDERAAQAEQLYEQWQALFGGGPVQPGDMTRTAARGGDPQSKLWAFIQQVRDGYAALNALVRQAESDSDPERAATFLKAIAVFSQAMEKRADTDDAEALTQHRMY